MKEFNFIKSTPNGVLEGVIRFVGKFVFLKKNNDSVELKRLIRAYKAKGASVEVARNWVKIDFIKDNKVVKLGDVEVNVDEMGKSDLETFLYNFYKDRYEKSGFLVKETQKNESVE